MVFGRQRQEDQGQHGLYSQFPDHQDYRHTYGFITVFSPQKHNHSMSISSKCGLLGLPMVGVALSLIPRMGGNEMMVDRQEK